MRPFRHGGNGYISSWGSARIALELLEKALSGKYVSETGAEADS